MSLTVFWTVYSFVIGLCIGSFLNVAVLRGLSGESLVLPPSHCTKCNHKLAWYDNIPVLSYLILRGKCRYCGEKISLQYPIVELFTALVFAGLYFKYGFTLNTLFLMAASAICIVLAVTDIKEKVIFDTHAYLLMALGLVYNFFNISPEFSAKITFWIFGMKISVAQSFIHSVLGLVAGFGAMALVALIFKVLLKRDGFGSGDFYILGALGAFWGITNAIVIFILSIFIWGGLAVPSFLFKCFKEKNFKLFAGLILFFLAGGLFFAGEMMNVFTSNLFEWFAFLLIASIGLYCCRQMIESIRQGCSVTIIPYGPALVFGAFVVMFVLG